jgi:riboflavin synthase
MFTGLIEATGRIESIARSDRGGRLRLRTPLGAELRPGDSLAVNGVCLTVTAQDADGVTADLAPATLAVTTFGDMREGRLVNLERPLRADARLGGHFVLGHVDATSRILSFEPDGECAWLVIAIPPALEPYVIAKGSIAIDGISLTIASLAPGRLAVQIVPFTRAHTALAEASAGDAVNLEADVLGKYVARLLAAEPDRVPSTPGQTS